MSPRTRRSRGDGALYQRHDHPTCPPSRHDHPACPPEDEDGIRPKHACKGSRPSHPCKGLWMATVDKAIGGDGKRKRAYVSGKDKSAVIAKLRNLRVQIDTHGDIPTRSMTVEKWLTHWLEHVAGRRNKPRTLQGYRTVVREHLIPHVGRYRLDRLAPQHVRDMQRALEAQGKAAGTVLKAHRVLGKALTDAEREGLIHKNVAKLVDAPRKDADEGVRLTSAQALAVIKHTWDDPLGSRWAAALLLGARQGELLGLEWDRVDLANWSADLSWQLQRLGYLHGCGDTCGRKRAGWCPDKVLDVPRGFEHRTLDGSSLVLTRPKAGKGRVVPLPPHFAVILTQAWEKADKPTRGLVWTTKDGDPIDPRRDHDAWKQVLEDAEVPVVALHAARHTTATLLMEAGVDAHVIASILGHSQVVTTRGYQHVDLTLARAALDALATKLGIEG